MQRRDFLRGAAWSATLWTTSGLMADQLTLTPAMTEGPFYPDKLPLDTDNDLLILNDALTPAVGDVTHLSGRVLTSSGEPIRNAFVEIWQCDNNGAYLHAGTDNDEGRDKNFQGYGRFLTDAKGQYYFRTIKPVPYPGRTPHIHFGVSRGGERILTTQLFVNGHPLNDGDGVLRGIRDKRAIASVMGDFKPLPNSPIGELEVSFDLVLGVTPQENDEGKLTLGVGKSERAQGKGFGPGGFPGGPGRPPRGPGQPPRPR